MSVTGNVKTKGEKTYKETRVEWKVNDFFSVTKDANDSSHLTSPTFSFADDLWFLQLIPRRSYIGIFNTVEWMLVYINIKRIREYSVEYDFGLKKLDGSVEQLLTGILKGGDFTNSGNNELIESTEIRRRKSELAPSNVLTITCTLRSETTQPTVLDQPKCKKLRKLDTLSENFKNLFANRENSDTTLRVEDKEYKVHKAVLITRSPVFAAMFQHETSEKETGIITIPDCDSESFKEFLEFLYCGQLEELPFLSALHLYQTSHKYDVQELKAFCVDCLKENLTAENVSEAATLADQYDDSKLLSAAQDFFNENSSKIFDTSEWEYLLKNNYRLVNKLLKGMSKTKI